MRSASGKNLLCKDGAFLYRRRIPKDLQGILGRSDISAPLGTRNKREAQRRANAYNAQLSVAFQRVRDGEIDDFDDARLWARSFANEALLSLQRGIDDEIEDSLSSDVADNVFEGMAVIGEIYSEGCDEDEEVALRAVLGAVGKLDPDLLPRETWRPVAIRLLKGIPNLRYTDPKPEPLVPAVPIAPVVVPVAAASNGELAKEIAAELSRAKHSRSLGFALEIFAELRAADSSIRQTTVDEVRKSQEFRHVEKMVNALGVDRLMDDVASVDVSRYLDGLVDSRVRKPGLVALPISSGTRKTKISQIARFFAVAVENEWCSKNVAQTVAKASNGGGKRSKKEEKRTAFPAEDLPKIFTAELQQLYGMPESRFAERFWMLASALSNGLRAEEAAQLLLADVQLVDGIRCFNIRVSNETQELKNDNAFRCIPCHPILKRIGFEKFIAYRTSEVEAAGEDLSTAQLYGGLTASKTHGWRNAGVQWFNGPKGYFASVGVYRKTTRIYHSLRHGFIGSLMEAGVADSFRLALSGHGGAPGDEGKTYKGTRSISRMLEELEKVDLENAFRHCL